MILIANLINIVFTLLNLAILARVLVSWVNPNPYHPAVQILHQITEPILAPIRRLLPPTGMIDFSPLVAIVLLSLLQRLLMSMLFGF
ncbi:MAG: YggT family protein [Chloroflexi bacterium]|nr:MAG: YggT family protein [Chloroflexota bacterium]